MSLDRERADRKKQRENYLDELNFHTGQHEAVKSVERLTRKIEQGVDARTIHPLVKGSKTSSARDHQ